MKERGIELDHATIQRWVVKYTPLLETKFRKRKKAVGNTAKFRQKFNKDLLLIGSVIFFGKGDDHIFHELCDITLNFQYSILFTLLTESVIISNLYPLRKEILRR